MSNDSPNEDSQTKATPESGQASATSDLAEGLSLMMRAAKKAVKRVDAKRIEEAGKRALASIESLDKKRVEELGRRAAKNLDPRKIEDVAEEAGRELLNVVERIADRVDDLVHSGPKKGSQPPNAPEEKNEAPGEEASAEKPKQRVRVDEP